MQKFTFFLKQNLIKILHFAQLKNSQSFLLGKIWCKSKQFVIVFCNPCKIVPPQECLLLCMPSKCDGNSHVTLSKMRFFHSSKSSQKPRMYDHCMTMAGLTDCCCMTGEFSSQRKSAEVSKIHAGSQPCQGTDQHTVMQWSYISLALVVHARI